MIKMSAKFFFLSSGTSAETFQMSEMKLRHFCYELSFILLMKLLKVSSNKNSNLCLVVRCKGKLQKIRIHSGLASPPASKRKLHSRRKSTLTCNKLPKLSSSALLPVVAFMLIRRHSKLEA